MKVANSLKIYIYATSLNVTCLCSLKNLFVAQSLYLAFRSMVMTIEILEHEKCCSEIDHEHD
jgi:hypothetical protein